MDMELATTLQGHACAMIYIMGVPLVGHVVLIDIIILFAFVCHNVPHTLNDFIINFPS